MGARDKYSFFDCGRRKPWMGSTPGLEPAPRLILCRQCLEYVFEGTDVCPHCAGDARAMSAAYRDGGYRAIEAIERIENVLKRWAG